MKQIVLIRHSITTQADTIPFAQWRLSPEGRQKCEQLAQRLARFELTRIISSEESKAVETAKLTDDYLGISAHAVDGLQELMRDDQGYIESKEKFYAMVAELFSNQDNIALGGERANQACERFSRTIDNLLESHPNENLGIVTHGTVLSLFVSAKNKIDGFDYWKSLKMPSFVMLSLPGYELSEIEFDLV